MAVQVVAVKAGGAARLASDRGRRERVVRPQAPASFGRKILSLYYGMDTVALLCYQLLAWTAPQQCSAYN